MAGASCLSNGSFIPLVAGSSWEVSHGIYKLVGCPAGHQLINSSDGSSKGIFSQESQFCKPCMPGQYIIDPKNGICQDCPDGTTYLPFNLNLTGRVKACTSNQDFPVFSTLFTILCPLYAISCQNTFLQVNFANFALCAAAAASWWCNLLL